MTKQPGMSGDIVESELDLTYKARYKVPAYNDAVLFAHQLYNFPTSRMFLYLMPMRD